MRTTSPDVVLRDAELIARIRRDDAAALGELMQCYAEELTTFALLIVYSIDLAQEAVQKMYSLRYGIDAQRSTLWEASAPYLCTWCGAQSGRDYSPA